MTVWTGTLPTIAAGGKILGSDIDTIRDAVGGLTDAWTTYTSTWRSSGTQPALGNGTLDAAYRQSGKFGQVSILLTVGSTSTFGTGTYRFDLPSTWSLSNDRCYGVSMMLDNTGNVSLGGVVFATATTITCRIHGTALANSVPTSAIPFTWATSDKWYLEWSGEVQP